MQVLPSVNPVINRSGRSCRPAPADRSRKDCAGAEAPVCTEAHVPVEAPVHAGAPVQPKQLFNALLTELNEFKSEI